MRRAKGHQYEINEIARIIKLKEKNGHDATFERDILKEWSTYSGWEYAGECLQSLPEQKVMRQRNRVVNKDVV